MKKKKTVVDALDFAIIAHKGQRRFYGGKDSGEYINHPITVFKVLSQVTDDREILIAGLLHDVVEDTTKTLKDIKDTFGDRVARIVKEVTKDKQGNFTLKTGEGAMVKLADMLHNLSDNPSEKYLKSKIVTIHEVNENEKKQKRKGKRVSRG